MGSFLNPAAASGPWELIEYTKSGLMIAPFSFASIAFALPNDGDVVVFDWTISCSNMGDAAASLSLSFGGTIADFAADGTNHGMTRLTGMLVNDGGINIAAQVQLSQTDNAGSPLGNGRTLNSGVTGIANPGSVPLALSVNNVASAAFMYGYIQRPVA